MRRVLLALLLSAGAAVAGAAPAEAGGPTSVLVTNPAQATAIALYYTDPRYKELDELLHGVASGHTTEDPAGTTYLNLTWLIHDVMPWRTETLALDPSGGAWLATETEGAGVAASDEVRWTRLGRPDRVRELVGSLGLLGRAGDAGGAGGGEAAHDSEAGGETASSTVVVAPPAPTVREETRWFSLTGWRWAVPGLLVGALGASLALRRRGESAPRRELIDRQPEPVL